MRTAAAREGRGGGGASTSSKVLSLIRCAKPTASLWPKEVLEGQT